MGSEGVQNFLLKRGINLKRVRGGVDVEMEGAATFLIILQFNHSYCVWGESKVPIITFPIFSLFS